MDTQAIIEAFTERAAIIEFDGGLSRTMAELKAKDECKARFGAGALTVINQFLREEQKR
jgi:hypothetical protein